MKLRKSLTALAALLVAGAAYAQPIFSFTFDSGPEDFWNAAWLAGGPAGWGGGSSIQQTNFTGGWTLGSSIGHEFDWASGQQVPMQNLANTGQGRISMDLMLDGNSFTPGQAYWYNIWLAGNSDGTAGWTQQMPVDGWHNADDPTLYVTHVDLAFADLGWQPGDNWFQLYMGSNTETYWANFYADNVTVYAVPEPSSLALAGLGVAALLVYRRRR